MEEKSSESLEERLVVAREWMEYGWGIHSIGYSLHLDQESYKEYVRDYWAGMPDKRPDEYEAPEMLGSPFPLSVSQELYERVKESENGIMLYKSDPAYGRIITTKSLER